MNLADDPRLATFSSGSSLTSSPPPFATPADPPAEEEEDALGWMRCSVVEVSPAALRETHLYEPRSPLRTPAILMAPASSLNRGLDGSGSRRWWRLSLNQLYEERSQLVNMAMLNSMLHFQPRRRILR